LTTDTTGGTNGSFGNENTGYVWANQITASASGTLTTIGLNVSTAAGHICVAIYADSGNKPTGSALGSSASVSAVSGWNDLNVSGSVSIVQNTKYWLVWQCDSSSLIPYAAATGSPETYALVEGTYGNWPSGTWSVGTSQIANLRMTYSSGATPVAAAASFGIGFSGAGSPTGLASVAASPSFGIGLGGSGVATALSAVSASPSFGIGFNGSASPNSLSSVVASVSFSIGFDGSPTSIQTLTSVPASASLGIGFSGAASVTTVSVVTTHIFILLGDIAIQLM
jgi:hypothetical protein